MELNQNLAQRRVFNSIAGVDPQSIEEYNKIIGSAVADIAADFGIVKVRYSIFASADMPITQNIPENLLLFETENEAGNPPVLFQYTFKEGTAVEFSVFIEAGKFLTEDEHWSLEIIFRQFYYILQALLPHLSCQCSDGEQIRLGYKGINDFIQFGNRLIAQGQAGQYTALYFNIHNFKSVYKYLTYMEANAVLEKYYEIVSNAVTKDELVIYLGSDNFTALIYDWNKDYFFDLIQNIIIKFEKDGETLSFPLGATIGAANLSEEKNAGDIMMNVTAAYQTARDNRVSFSYYDRNTSLEILEQKIILSKFSDAINEHEFFAMYQPKVDAKSQTLLGAEALVRWRHDNGFIMPGSFIPVFEKDGCVTTLDFYMLEEVCKFLAKLRSAGIDLVKISVNFSKRHLSDNKLVEEIAEIIDRYDIPHQYIEIELTEGEDFRNEELMKNVVNELNILGIKTSIDDFGTGYSSLSMLSSLQLDELKIDRSFIPQHEINDGDKSLLMLSSMINLAKNLGLTVVAEGVETKSQLEIIRDMDCDIVQGYIFDKPLTENDFIARIKQKVYALSSQN